MNNKTEKVRGILGIASIFGCSLPMAQKLKKSVIKDAVTQNGRCIITDVEKAKSLYREWAEKSGKSNNLPNFVEP